MTPRPYQVRCVESVLAHWANHRSTLAILATGLGKTLLPAMLANRERDQSYLVVAHRDELVRQAADELSAFCQEPVGIEMAEDAASNHCRIVVASVQTLSRPNRRERFAPGRFGRVVVDEAHHAVARSYRDVLDYFERARVLGVTATPKRSDQLAMGQVFESVAYDYGIAPAIEDGYLVPVRQYAVRVEGLDFSHLKTVAGDLSDSDLEAILTEEGVPQRMALPALEVAGDLPGIFFCATVRHALLMEAVLNRYKPGCAKALSGETPRDERRLWVERYKSGGVQWLCNCGLFLEGFNAPQTAVVVMGRPTKSLALYTQCIGRGTRPLRGLIDSDDLAGDDARGARRAAIAQSDKPACLVLDFVGNSGRHKIVSALDVLGGKYGEPVRRYAQKTIAEEGQGVPTDEALARAEAEMALEEEEQERRRRIKAREAYYDIRAVSPFAGDGGSTSNEIGAGRDSEPATSKQVNLLVYRFGWSRSRAESLHKRQAITVIDKLMRRAGEGSPA